MRGRGSCKGPQPVSGEPRRASACSVAPHSLARTAVRWVTLGGSRASLGLSFRTCQGSSRCSFVPFPVRTLGIRQHGVGAGERGRYLWGRCPAAKNPHSFICSANIVGTHCRPGTGLCPDTGVGVRHLLPLLGMLEWSPASRRREAYTKQ